MGAGASAPAPPRGERRGRRLARSILVVAALACGGCAESFDAEDASPDPVELLVERPALPPTWVVDGVPRPISWRRTAGGGRVQPRTCEGAGAVRGWSEHGDPFAVPAVDQAACVYRSEDAADDAYDSSSLLEVGGEDWTNYVYGPEERTVPADTAFLGALAADEAEVGCGVGDARSLCALWGFRARYAHVLVDVEFVASGGGIHLRAARNLIGSVDRELARRLPQ